MFDRQIISGGKQVKTIFLAGGGLKNLVPRF